MQLAEVAGDDGGEISLPVQSFEMERVTRVLSEQADKGELGAAVALAKRVDGVELAQERREVVEEGFLANLAKTSASCSFWNKLPIWAGMCSG